ncbi:TetR family transcriptional regulator [soil metagenome]
MNYNDKQLQIISTAEELFAAQGFEGTSVRDIAEAAGINIAMISYYFGSKEKLLEALFEQRTDHIKMKVETLLKDETLGPFEKLDALIDGHIAKAVDMQLFYKIMVTEHLVNKNLFITDALIQLKKRNIEVVKILLDDGENKGVFKKGADVFMLMSTLIGIVSHNVMNQKFYREFYQQTDMSDDAFRESLKQKLSLHIKQIFKSILSNV